MLNSNKKEQKPDFYPNVHADTNPLMVKPPVVRQKFALAEQDKGGRYEGFNPALSVKENFAAYHGGESIIYNVEVKKTKTLSFKGQPLDFYSIKIDRNYASGINHFYTVVMDHNGMSVLPIDDAVIIYQDSNILYIGGYFELRVAEYYRIYKYLNNNFINIFDMLEQYNAKVPCSIFSRDCEEFNPYRLPVTIENGNKDSIKISFKGKMYNYCLPGADKPDGHPKPIATKDIYMRFSIINNDKITIIDNNVEEMLKW